MAAMKPKFPLDKGSGKGVQMESFKDTGRKQQEQKKR